MDPGTVKREAALGGRVLAASLGVGILAAGVGLLGLALAILLEVVGAARFGLAPSVGEGLGAALVLASVGWFFLGAAWEGLLGLAPGRNGTGSDRMALLWGSSGLVVGIVLALAGRAAAARAVDLWPGLPRGGEMLWAAGMAGAVSGPLVAAAIWGAERLRPEPLAYERWRVPILTAAWAVGTVVVFMAG